MKLEFNISLQRIACNSAAAAIWDKELTHIETQEIFYSESHSENREKWYSLVKDVIKKINQDLLPAVLYQELLSAIMYMGLRIFGWFEHLNRIFGGFGHEISRKDLFDNYIKKIYWTHYGTIDELKIFKLVWLKNPKFNICQMYNMACIYFLKEEVEAFWKKISSSKELTYPKYDVRNRNLHILCYWNNYQNPSDSFMLTLLNCNSHVEEIYDEKQTVEENMLKLCALTGNHIGFKYFWNKLDDDKKKSNAVICFKIILENPSCYDCNDEFVFAYFEDRFYEIFTLLVQNIPEKMATDLMVHDSGFPHERIFNFIDCLPWRELLFPLINLVLQKCKEKSYGELISSIGTALERETAFHLPIENSGLQRKLKQIWQKTTKRYKLDRIHSLTYTLLKVWDLATIRFILDDKDLKERRGSLLRTIARVFTLIERNKIEQMFCELLIIRELKENDESLLKTIYKHLLHNNLSSVDYFLNKCISDDNAKRDLKNKLEIEYIIYYYIEKNDYDSADKILFWMFESTERVNDFKKQLKNNEFAKDHILDIWSTSKENFELAILQSNTFLFWLVNNSKVDSYKFKVKMFKNVNHINFMRRLVIEFMKIRVINQFLVWCLWTDVEIEKFMKILVTNKDRIIYCLDLEKEEKFRKCFFYAPF